MDITVESQDNVRALSFGPTKEELVERFAVKPHTLMAYFFALVEDRLGLKQPAS